MTATESFVMVAARLVHDVENGTVTLEELGLAVWLLRRSDPATGQARRTLTAIAAAIDWQGSRDTLQRRLRKLEALGWWTIEPVKPGQHKPWVFTMTGAAVERDLRKCGGDSAEVASSARRSTRRSVRSSGKTATVAAKPRSRQPQHDPAEVVAEVGAEALRSRDNLDVVQEVVSTSDRSEETATGSAPLAAAPSVRSPVPPPAIVDDCMGCLEKLPLRTHDGGRTYYCDDCAPLAGGAHA